MALRAAYASEAIALTLVSEKRNIKKSPEYANSFFALAIRLLVKSAMAIRKLR